MKRGRPQLDLVEKLFTSGTLDLTIEQSAVQQGRNWEKGLRNERNCLLKDWNESVKAQEEKWKSSVQQWLRTDQWEPQVGTGRPDGSAVVTQLCRSDGGGGKEGALSSFQRQDKQGNESVIISRNCLPLRLPSAGLSSRLQSLTGCGLIKRPSLFRREEQVRIFSPWLPTRDSTSRPQLVFLILSWSWHFLSCDKCAQH